ncbi:hypothetical protein LZ30DRAFT_827350 [Colletotrichum cereale]|nr:hypothetical protein LZ30DRAFT_827350 [Colletotrichum cereale]
MSLVCTASVSNLKYWDPANLLQIVGQERHAEIRCVGRAMSRGGARCRWTVDYERRIQIEAKLEQMAGETPADITTGELRDLAELCLCRDWHSHQQEDTVRHWRGVVLRAAEIHGTMKAELSREQNRKITKLQDELRAKEADLQRSREQYRSLEREFDSTRCAQAKMLESQENELLEIRQQLKSATENVKHLKTLISDHHQRLEQTITSLSKEMARRISTLEDEKKELKASLELSTQKSAKAQCAMEALSLQTLNSKLQAEFLSRNVAKLEADIAACWLHRIKSHMRGALLGVVDTVLGCNLWFVYNSDSLTFQEKVLQWNLTEPERLGQGESSVDNEVSEDSGGDDEDPGFLQMEDTIDVLNGTFDSYRETLLTTTAFSWLLAEFEKQARLDSHNASSIDSIGEFVLTTLSGLKTRSTGTNLEKSLYDGTVISYRLTGTSPTISCVGMMDSIIDVAEVLAWLGSALREAGPKDKMTYITPQISCASTIGESTADPEPLHTTHLVLRFEEEDTEYREMEVANGLCWLGLFENPVIAKGFPVLRCGHEFDGLTIPLSVMAYLADASKLTLFNSQVLLKGFNVALVPASRSPDAKYHDLWTDPDFVRPGFVLEKFILQGGPEFLTFGVEIPVGKKDPLPAIRRGKDSYLESLELLENEYIVLYDTNTRQAWLSNGVNALLHLARASLRENLVGSSSGHYTFADSKLRESA